MTRELLTRALDALSAGHHFGDYQDLCAAIRTHLAAPQPEPVAEVYRAHFGGNARNIGVDDVRKLQGAVLPPPGTKLYAAPPAAPADSQPCMTKPVVSQKGANLTDNADMVMVPRELLRQLKHYTVCYLLHWPNCGAPTEAEIDAELAAAPAPAVPEMETRADGKLVRVDRWEWGIRRIVALLWGNRKEFEIDEVVQAVKEIVPYPHEDDESLCTAVERLSAAPAVHDPLLRAAIEQDPQLSAAYKAIAAESAAPVVREPLTDAQLLDIYWKSSWNSDGKSPMETWERDYSNTMIKGLRAVAKACYGIGGGGK